MKLRIWGKISEGSGSVRIFVKATMLPADAALVRVRLNIPELSEQELYGEAEVYSAGTAEISVFCQIDEGPQLWNEFTPKLYKGDYSMDVVMAIGDTQNLSDSFNMAFAAFRPIGTQFAESGRAVFIRGAMIGGDKLSDEMVEGTIKDIRRRGLNCVSVRAEELTDKLLCCTDIQGIYVKAEGDIDHDRWSVLDHPSLVLSGNTMGGMADTAIPWMEFAVRDRQDYSDAPDTKSDHREDVYGQDYPTIMTNVGEWRHGAEQESESSKYLARICCREEMESALRTPSFGGFILQENAEVFSYSAKLMREFSGAVVPLLMMKKYVWSADETFTATVLIANYSDRKFFERVSVTATDEQGQRYTKMSNRIRINRGSLVSTGEVSIPLEQFTPGQAIELQVSIDDTEYRNHYTIWLFSDNISVKVPNHVHVTRRLDERTENLLAAGKKVIYIPKLNRLPYEPGWFSPLASQAAAHREKVASGGVMCNADHPALKNFPTESIGDFQWWNLVHNSTPIPVCEKLQKESIVYMKDNGVFKAYIGEMRVGEGKLIYSAIDLLIQLDRPEARQLYAGLLAYAASDRFAPKTTITFKELEQI